MTKEELNQLYYLDKELYQLKQEIAELESAAINTAVKLSDMPHGGDVSDSVGRIAAKIADLQLQLEDDTRRRYQEYCRLMLFIDTINDSLIRQIFYLRYVKQLRWNSIANIIGGNNTENSVKQAHSRYLRSTQK